MTHLNTVGDDTEAVQVNLVIIGVLYVIPGRCNHDNQCTMPKTSPTIHHDYLCAPRHTYNV